MRWPVARAIVLMTTLSWGSSALADDVADAADAVVTIGDVATGESDRVELPAMEIHASSAAPTVENALPLEPVRVVASASPPAARRETHPGELVIDPATGLMIPRFASAEGSSRDNPLTSRRRRTPSHGLRVDPSTGLMIPDFGESTMPAAASAPANRPPRSTSRQPTISGDMQIDPATGLMIPRSMRMPAPL